MNQAAALGSPTANSGRKVRAPQGMMPGNARDPETGTDSATENIPLGVFRLAGKRTVRVKRRGKSPPRHWRQRRKGKPHQEQSQVCAGPAARRLSAGRLQKRAGNGFFRQMAAAGFGRKQNPAYGSSCFFQKYYSLN